MTDPEPRVRGFGYLQNRASTGVTMAITPRFNPESARAAGDMMWGIAKALETVDMHDIPDAEVVAGGASNDAARVLEVYRNRPPNPALYSALQPSNILAVQQRERVLLKAVADHWRGVLSSATVLDIGCGTGTELARWVVYGVNPDQLHGVDLRADVLALTRLRIPGADIRECDAASLPYEDEAFDFVLQYTTLSSILDDSHRSRVAVEMLRVLKPSGMIVSYDFWINPGNKDTRGVGRTELRRLFAGQRLDVVRVTLAPPVARRLARYSTRLTGFLQALPLATTHLMAFVTKTHGDSSTNR